MGAPYSSSLICSATLEGYKFTGISPFPPDPDDPSTPPPNNGNNIVQNVPAISNCIPLLQPTCYGMTTTISSSRPLVVDEDLFIWTLPVVAYWYMLRSEGPSIRSKQLVMTLNGGLRSTGEWTRVESRPGGTAQVLDTAEVAGWTGVTPPPNLATKMPAMGLKVNGPTAA